MNGTEALGEEKDETPEQATAAVTQPEQGGNDDSKEEAKEDGTDN